MSWKNPDAEIHLRGWPAVIVMVIFVLDLMGSLVRAVELAAGYL